MKIIELGIEAIILGARWLLVLFYLGLVAGLAVYAWSFALKLQHMLDIGTLTDGNNAMLTLLALVDAAMVASLVIMVIISGYESFVSRFDRAVELSWLGKIGAGTLKVKIGTTIVAISSIGLLQVFLNAGSFDKEQILVMGGLHILFVGSAIALAVIDRMTGHHA